MNISTELILHITPVNNTILLETNDDGLRSCKQISYDTMVQSIKGSLARDMVHSGLLPAGCISFQEGAEGKSIVSLLHGERYADVNYMGTEYPHFPLPRLVFKFEHLKGHRVQKCCMGVVGEGMLTPESPMYRYPFSNVSGYNLCVGNNVLPKCKSLHTLSSLPYYILSMPNNNDRFQSANNREKLEMRDLMELLKDKDPDYYYSDILIPNKGTLKNFIQ